MHHPMPFGKVPVSCCRTFLWHLPGARMQAGAPAGRLPSTLSFANVGNIWEYNSPMSKLSTIYKQQNLLAAFLGWNVESILPPLARLTRAWLATHSPGKVINTSCYDSYNCSHKAAATIEFSPLRTCCFACSLNFLCVCVWVPVYCSSWNSCPQGLKRTHCKTTKNIQEPYQEQVCLQKSMNSWSLAASGRAELSICGALTATNNQVLSNRVIAASSLNWFGLPPLSFLWCCYTIPSIYRPCSE